VRRNKLSGIRKEKDKVKKIILMCDAGAPNKPRKHMKMG
jgi:hypothetical protein